MITAFWPNMVGKLCISKPIVATRKPGFMSLLYNSGEACEHGWTVGEANIRSLLFLCLIWPPLPRKKKVQRTRNWSWSYFLENGGVMCFSASSGP